MINRRHFFIKTFVASLAYVSVLSAKDSTFLGKTSTHNFKTIYDNPELKDRFLGFLSNVFNLYPEKALHQLIADMVKIHRDDQSVYMATQNQLESISPTLSLFRYQLPALWHQKEEMTEQTVKLLGKGSTYNGYLELGSSGRYLDYLEEEINIEGKRYYIDVNTPGYGIDEMVDRGQITVGAEFIPLENYKTDFSAIKKESLDLVCVYIGFHHIPLDLRRKFIEDVASTMRVGATLILRDHDCHNGEQTTIAALAHDVFNMGTNETWDYNQNELRNFYSLDYIQAFVKGVGFTLHPEVLYQKGDPSKNALMMFKKVENV